MQLAQTVSMAFKAISGNKVRAFLTMLGVIIGVIDLGAGKLVELLVS